MLPNSLIFAKWCFRRTINIPIIVCKVKNLALKMQFITGTIYVAMTTNMLVHLVIR